MRTRSLTIESGRDTNAFPQTVPIRCLPDRSALIWSPHPASDCRSYLRRLRAAEMAAWEQTGGDYLRSDYAARDF